MSKHSGARRAEVEAWRSGRRLMLQISDDGHGGADATAGSGLAGLAERLAAVDGLERVRVSYLQPAEVRPGLLEAVAGTPGVVPYFDISFQHAAPGVLRRMRRFGGTEAFLDLLAGPAGRAVLDEAGFVLP